MNMTDTLKAFDSKSPAYNVLRNALGGFRLETQDLAATFAAIIKEAVDAETKHKLAGLAESVAALPVAIAGIGAETIAALSEGKASLPDAGDAGFTVSFVGTRGLEILDEDGKTVKRDGAFGLAVYPAHSVDAYLATEEGRGFVAGIIAKEAGLIAFRGLRLESGVATLSDFAAAAQGIPRLVSEYTDRSRASADKESFAIFNDFWETVKAVLSKNPGTAKVVLALPTRKADILSAIRSKAYAQTLFPAVETPGYFVAIANVVANFTKEIATQAEAQGRPFDYDLTAIARWIEGRENLDLLPKAAADVDLGGVDFASLM